MSEALESQNAILVAALQAIVEMSAGPTLSEKSFDMASIHETAADALADINGGDLTAFRSAGDVLFRGIRDNFHNVSGPILPAYYPHRPAAEVLIAGMVLLSVKMVDEQDIDLGGAMAEIVAHNREAV